MLCYPAVRTFAVLVVAWCALAVACGGGDSPAGTPATTPLAGGDVQPEASPGPPRLLMPDLQTMPFRELFITSDGTGTRILRFSTSVLNAGEGPLEMIGAEGAVAGEIVATQRLMRDDGSLQERQVGRFLFHPEHEHWHVEDFTMLEVWTYDEQGEVDQLMASTGKATFCAVDEVPELDHAPPPAYLTCGEGIQGISAGWSDTYAAAIAGQELDISTLPDGRYALRSTVDPVNRLAESDDDNNALIAYVEITGDLVEELH